MHSSRLEYASKLFSVSQAMAAAETPAKLLQAFLEPLWGESDCNSLLVYVEDEPNSQHDSVIEVLASVASSPRVKNSAEVGGRYRASENIFISTFLLNMELFRYLPLDDSSIPALAPLFERWYADGLKSLSIISLKNDSDKLIGLIAVQWMTLHPFTDEAIEFYQELLPVMTSLLERQHKILQIERALQLSEALYQANYELVRADGYDEILNVIFRYGRQIGAKVASLMAVELTESDTPVWGMIVARAGAESGAGSPLGSRFYLPDIPFTRVWVYAGEDEVLLIEDTQTDERTDAVVRQQWRKIGVGASVLMPLKVNGSWIGLLMMNWDERHLFTSFDIQFYKALSTQVATVLENQRLREAEHVAMADLAKERESYRLLADNATDMISHATAGNGTLLYVSPSSVALLGYTPEEMIGRLSREFVHAEDLPAIQRAYAALGKHEDSIQFQCRMRRSDGDYLWVEAVNRLIRDADGVGQELITVTRDISKRKQAEDTASALNAELLSQTVKLEDAVHELEAFTYSVSHDLRAPLRAMDGFSKILSEKYYDQIPEDGRRYLDRVRANAVQMGNLIDDLLNLSRITKRPLEERPCDMRHIADTSFREALGGQDPAIVNFTLADIPPCEGDPGLLKQVFVNLLTNAIKFSRTRPNPTIKVGAIQENVSEPIYFVSDNGVGFDMQYVDKVFGVFQRLHDARTYEGTGVGMAIAKRVISRHGGRIWVESVLNEGTTFYFTVGENHD